MEPVAMKTMFFGSMGKIDSSVNNRRRTNNFAAETTGPSNKTVKLAEDTGK
jgi:hypothetical protein